MARTKCKKCKKWGTRTEPRGCTCLPQIPEHAAKRARSESSSSSTSSSSSEAPRNQTTFHTCFQSHLQTSPTNFCFQLLLFLRSARRRRSWIRPALRRRGWMSRRSRLRPSSRLAATNKNILQQFVLYPHRLFFSGERRPRRAHHSPQCAHRAAAGGSAGSSAGHDQTQLKYLAMFILMCCRCSKESF